uniref:C-type lectin domain-containing protein n=1 Tax=Panagrolaimus davidi TaxID=227884 RepID=A0A914PE60_9BILA
MKAGTWSWIDKSSFDFNNWVNGEPRNSSDSNCGAALIRGGKWITDNCNKLKQFVCEYNTSISSTSVEVKSDPPKCPESWVYYNTTGFCYKLIRPNTTWHIAEALCVKENAHLASIHSYSENLFITCKRFLQPYTTL